jgi:hypothetical protein
VGEGRWEKYVTVRAETYISLLPSPAFWKR